MIENLFLGVALCCIPLLIIIGYSIKFVQVRLEVDTTDMIIINRHLVYSDQIRRREN